jgi:hypothetical protein
MTLNSSARPESQALDAIPWNTSESLPSFKGRWTLNTKDIQNLTGWGRVYVQQLVAARTLPNVGHANKILVPVKALLAYLESAGQSAA